MKTVHACIGNYEFYCLFELQTNRYRNFLQKYLSKWIFMVLANLMSHRFVATVNYFSGLLVEIQHF